MVLAVVNTIESPTVRELWNRIYANLGDDVVMFGGSVPQQDEQDHSYHRSWMDSPHDDGYSVHFPGDRRTGWLHAANAANMSAALDVSFHKAEDIRKYTARLHHFCLTQHHVPRRFGLREFAGTLDSVNTFGWDATVRARTYGWDSSHLFHIHLSFNRRHCNHHRILRLADVFAA